MERRLAVHVGDHPRVVRITFDEKLLRMMELHGFDATEQLLDFADRPAVGLCPSLGETGPERVENLQDDQVVDR